MYNILWIIKKYNNTDYFENIFGKHPIPIINDWSELYDLYDSIVPNLNHKIELINDWYFNFKETVRIKIFNLLNNKL